VRLLVHEGRTAARCLFPPHADLVLAQVPDIARERIRVADAPAVQVDDDVAAAVERRQGVAIAAAQGKALDALGQPLDAADAYV